MGSPPTMTPASRTCKACGQDRPLSGYQRHGGYYRRVCRDCEAGQRRADRRAASPKPQRQDVNPTPEVIWGVLAPALRAESLARVARNACGGSVTAERGTRTYRDPRMDQ